MDPIGLLGGERPYGYVHNPLEWVDPLGLAKGGCDQLENTFGLSALKLPLLNGVKAKEAKVENIHGGERITDGATSWEFTKTKVNN